MEFDKDLAARQEARTLCRQAEIAAKQLRRMTQQQLDAIVSAMSQAFALAATQLAELAVQETGFGNAADKTIKNRFAAETVARSLQNMTCVGLLEEDAQRKLCKIGVPVGVIAAIVPAPIPPPPFATRPSSP